MFIRFDVIHERDGRTDGQTDNAWQQRPRLCVASRGKNNCSYMTSTVVIDFVQYVCCIFEIGLQIMKPFIDLKWHSKWKVTQGCRQCYPSLDYPGYLFAADSIGLSSSRRRAPEKLRSDSLRSFKVIQGHRQWYQSKSRNYIPIFYHFRDITIWILPFLPIPILFEPLIARDVSLGATPS